MEFKRIAVDTSKSVFTLHGVGPDDRCILRRDLSRAQFERFFDRLPPTVVVLEACGGSHYWGRRLSGFGHEVRLIPPQYVRPFVKRGKNDHTDAEAINEAASRPTMRFVPVKSEHQQADGLALRVREMLVAQRTQTVNALRGHAAEFGLVAPRGRGNVPELVDRITASAMPAAAKAALKQLGERIVELDKQIAQAELALLRQHRQHPLSRELTKVPGVGPITALTLALTIDAGQFGSGRHFAAWLGLTPKEHSSGGRRRLGGISRAGNERLRELLVVGATSVVRHARPGRSSAWLLGLLGRKPRKLAAVALANKMARVVWAMMARGEAYRPGPAVS